MPDSRLPSPGELCALLRQVGHDEILPRYRRVGAEAKADGSLVTEADLAVQRRIEEALQRLEPKIPLLAEEMTSEAQERLLNEASAGFWCLDPLDGTTNFAAGFPFFAISLALIRQGEPILGAVYDPLREECFSAVRGGGCWLNDASLCLASAPIPLAEALAVVDFKRLEAGIGRRLVDRPPFRSLRSLGSVALEWCWLAAGRFHVYLHGGQRLWDTAAGSLILSVAGGGGLILDHRAARGDELSLQPKLTVAAGQGELLAQWRGWLGL